MTRNTVIKLLDDDYGISVEAWKDIVDICDDNDWLDIVSAVRIQDGRAYLPEGWDSE